MTTRTISVIESAINGYLDEERKARAELVSKLCMICRHIEIEYGSLPGGPDAPGKKKAEAAYKGLRAFIDRLQTGHPASRGSACGLST